MLISVIIPVYNVEKYLEQCVTSVLNQTYRDIEVILVDDGSTDGSPAICDRYAQQDKRVKVYHTSNGGAARARNIGLEYANGDYIIFMDSDDFWQQKDNLESLVKEAHATPECDFIGFNCSYYYQNTDYYTQWPKFNTKIQYPCTPSDSIPFLVKSGLLPVSACLKLIKRNSIYGRVKFQENLFSEDIQWFIDLMATICKCRFVNLYMYAYRKATTTSKTSSFSQRQYFSLLHILKQNANNKIDSWNIETQEAILSFWAYELCILRAMTGFMDKEQRVAELKKLYEYDWLFKYTLNPKVRKVALVQKLFGKKITTFVLYRYLRTRLV